MKRFISLLLLFFFASLVQAQMQTPKGALEQFFSSETLEAAWFTDDFLAQVPPAQLEVGRQQFTDEFGAFERVEGEDTPFTVVLERGTLQANISLDAAGKIAGLQLQNPQPGSEQPSSDQQNSDQASSGGAASDANANSETASDLTPRVALERLFIGETIEPAWFTDAFLNEVPVARLETILAQYTDQLGAFVQLKGEASPFTAVFESGSAAVQISLDNQGHIAGLFFQAPTPTVGSLEDAAANFRELEGEVSLLVLQDGSELTALNADAPLAVGSAFKLAVLTALQAQVEAGERRWDEVVTLDTAWKSLPSGILQTWSDGSPLTLNTLATLMISQSDNTATDALLNLVGRKNVEALGVGERPFLSTQELFKLRAPANAELLQRYQNGDEAAKRQVLEELETLPLPNVGELPNDPAALDVEWHLSAVQLCDLMAGVEALELMSVNPGVADPANWARVAFKGGSEPGVLNLTTWLEREDGTHYCVTATQNRQDAALDEEAFFGYYSALLGALP